MTAQLILNDLLADVAVLIAQRIDKEIEKEALEKGKMMYEQKGDCDKVYSYERAIGLIQRRINDLQELIDPRLRDIQIVKERISNSPFQQIAA